MKSLSAQSNGMLEAMAMGGVATNEMKGDCDPDYIYRYTYTFLQVQRELDERYGWVVE